MTAEEKLLGVLREMTLEELLIELKNIEIDYQRKLLTTVTYNVSVELTQKVLEEKRQEQDVTDAYKRAMLGI